MIKRQRGRPRKDSSNTSVTPTSNHELTTVRGRGRPSKASTLGSASVSSVPTPGEVTSESEYSTPGTSKVPTPATQERPEKLSSIQVQLPSSSDIRVRQDRERSLRTSIYSMSGPARKSRTVIEDTDDEEDDFSDTSPDAKLARRLQDAEEKAAPKPADLSRGRRGRASDVVPSELAKALDRASTKRRRSSPNLPLRGSSSVSRPSKRIKVGSDPGTIDIDAEIAAGADLPLDQIEDSIDESSFSEGDDLSDDLGDLYDSSEDEPISKKKLAARKPLPKPARSARAVRKSVSNSARLSGAVSSTLNTLAAVEDDSDELSEADVDGSTEVSSMASGLSSAATSDGEVDAAVAEVRRLATERRAFRRTGSNRRLKKERDRLLSNHPEVETMWQDLEKMPVIKAERAAQPTTISRQLKPFQLEGLSWMTKMEKMEWKGGLLGGK